MCCCLLAKEPRTCFHGVVSPGIKYNNETVLLTHPVLLELGQHVSRLGW